jgi:predicted nucleic acid-binding protein
MPTIEPALALVNTVMAERKRLPVWRNDCSVSEALCRALKAHDATLAELAAKDAELNAYKREVSDEAERILNCTNINKRYAACLSLNRFTLPKPVDPLVEAIREASVSDADDGDASRLRAALAKRGLKLVEVGDAD